jgi:drug/metabolite transporter (DMT)-like permease
LARPIIYALLLVIMMIWGLNVIAIKILVNNFSPVTITALRIITAGVVVMAILGARKKFRKLTPKETFYMALAALTGVLGHHFFLAIGLTKTTASNAGLILGLVPLMTSIFAMLFLGDRLTMLKFLGIILGLSGVSFIVLNGNNLGAVSIGDISIFMAVVTQAISFISIKQLTATVDSRLLTGWMLVVGSSFLFTVSLVMEPEGTSTLGNGSPVVWGVFLLSAVLATGVGHLIYNNAIHHLGAGETAIFNNFTPFFSLIGAYLFLGEDITYFQLLGFVSIVAGVILGTGALENKKHQYNIVRLKKLIKTG